MNTRIEWLQEQIVAIQGFAEKELASFKEDPNNHAAQFFASSHTEHLAELQQELRLEQAKRQYEVFELRLMGNQVDNASIPLSLLAKIAEPISKLLAGASYRLRHQRDAHIIPAEWVNMLDLRLAGISPGSSRMVMTGDVAPDLAGDSPLQDALEALFQVLSTRPEDFVERLHAIGVRAGGKLAELLDVLEKEDVACELSWIAPSNHKHKWKATRADMAHLRVMLEGVEEPQESTVELTGEITLLAATGRIELLSEGEKVKVTFNKRAPELISNFHIGQHVTIQALCTTYYDPIKDQNISKFALLSDEE